MALEQTRAQMRSALRRFANVRGTSALQRHPDADLNDYLDRGLARLRYLLSQAVPDQRFLVSTTFSTVKAQTVYPLPADFTSLLSVDILADSRRTWLEAYELNERPVLTSPDVSHRGIPFCYRERGGNIELLPSPTAGYPVTLWYLGRADQLGSDASSTDTINRLDDYVVAYAARFVATADKNWDLLGECKALMGELEGEIQFFGRSRDQNSPSRVVDTYVYDRYGRLRGRRYR